MSSESDMQDHVAEVRLLETAFSCIGRAIRLAKLNRSFSKCQVDALLSVWLDLYDAKEHADPLSRTGCACDFDEMGRPRYEH